MTNGETNWKDYCGLKRGAGDYGVRGDHASADVAAAAGDDGDGDGDENVVETSESDDDREVSVNDADAHAEHDGEEVLIDASAIRGDLHRYYRVCC